MAAAFLLSRGAAVAARFVRAASTEVAPGVKNVSVYGSGLMGSGIVQVAAATNLYSVTMVDTADALLGKAQDRIAKSLVRVAKKKHAGDENAQTQFVEAVMANITTTTCVQTGASAADLVIEAVPESIDLKHTLFKAIDQAAPKDAIFASNTSSLNIGRIAECTTAARQARFGGLHFFNPVPMMRLVEVVSTSNLDPAVFATLKQFGSSVGKHVVACKDTPGFIVNRLLVPYMLEAVRLVERGEATPEDVDAAMKLGAGYPMGPFELMDYVGLDTTSLITAGWAKDFPDVELFQPVPTVDAMVAEGKFGMKSGEGFYKYTAGKKV